MQWFKHDSNANTDDKLQIILLDYGLEGYGLYWYCLELIVNRVDKDNINFELKHDARIIARNTGSTVQKVEEMMKRFVELGLFENNKGMITCIKLIKRMDSSMTSNSYMRDLITKAKSSHDVIMTQSENVMQEENRREEIRIEKNINKSMTLSEYLQYCKQNDLSILPKDCCVFKNAEKLTITDEMLQVAWYEFKEFYKDSNKKQADWVKFFNNAVKQNYYKVWRFDENQNAVYSDTGKGLLNIFRKKNG